MQESYLLLQSVPGFYQGQIWCYSFSLIHLLVFTPRKPIPDRITASTGPPVSASQRQSSECALLGAKTSVFACLSIHFSSFPILRLDSEAQLSIPPAEGRTRGLASFPQPGYQSHVPEGPQSSFTGQ